MGGGAGATRAVAGVMPYKCREDLQAFWRRRQRRRAQNRLPGQCRYCRRMSGPYTRCSKHRRWFAAYKKKLRATPSPVEEGQSVHQEEKAPEKS